MRSGRKLTIVYDYQRTYKENQNYGSIKMNDNFITQIGAWGCRCQVDISALSRSTDRAGRRDQRHYNYLKKHNPTVINLMRLKGILKQYLINLDHDAQEMYDRFVRRYA